jgi:hypothetical protein
LPSYEDDWRLLPTNGKWVIVDKTDCEWLSQYRWGHPVRFRPTPRVAALIDGVPVGIARFICGVADAGALVEVHHINGNPLDNRRSNLRAMPRWCHRRLHRDERRAAS